MLCWNAPKECSTINSLCFAHCRHVVHSICWWRGCRLRKHCSALVKATRAWSAATLLRYVQPLNLCCSHTSCFFPCSLLVSLQTNTQGRTTVHTTGQMQAEKHRSLLPAECPASGVRLWLKSEASCLTLCHPLVHLLRMCPHVLVLDLVIV